MRVFALTTVLASSLAFATVPQGALAAAPSKSKSSKKKGKDKPTAASDDGSASVPEVDGSPRVGRVFIDTAALGDAGPVIAGRATRVAEGAFESSQVTPTDALAGPELRVEIRYRDSGGYQVEYEIVYDGDPVDDGTGSFECQLCTEDELIEKVEALAKQVAPKMVVPQEEDGPPDPEIDIGPQNGGNGEDGNGGNGDGPVGGDEEPGKLQGMGKAGIGLLVVGGAATITGVVLIAVPRPELEVEPGGFPEVRATREFGYGVLGGGIVLAVVGGVLLGMDLKRAKQRRDSSKAGVSLLPWVRRDGAGLGMSGRF